jgi:hypothetical protein
MASSMDWGSEWLPPRVETWDFEKLGLMTLDKIREMYTPLNHFRVSRQEYPAGAEFPGFSRQGACFVLQGQVTFRFEKIDAEISLSAGEFAYLPEGDFYILIGMNEAALLVRVWELPAAFCPN